MRSFLLISLIASAMGLSACSASNMRIGLPRLAEDAPFGAIAYSRTRQSWQSVSDEPTRQTARAKALAGCKARDCQILTVFKKSECATLSLDGSRFTKEPFVSVAYDETTAKRAARHACRGAGGRACKVAPAVCN